MKLLKDTPIHCSKASDMQYVFSITPAPNLVALVALCRHNIETALSELRHEQTRSSSCHVILELELLPPVELQAPKFGDATSSLVCRQSAVKVGKPALRCYISSNVSSPSLDTRKLQTISKQNHTENHIHNQAIQQNASRRPRHAVQRWRQDDRVDEQIDGQEAG